MSFEKSHPWLTFSLDLRRIPWTLWLQLGEVISKFEHLAHAALRPETSDRLMRMYLAKGALASTAIEGNTLTEQQVLARMEGRLELPPSKAYLGVEVDNIVRACNEIVGEYLSGTPRPVSRQLICEYNRYVLADLSPAEGVIAGEVRTYSVGVADYRGAPARDVPHLLDHLGSWLSERWLTDHSGPVGDESGRLEAVLKAIVAHVYLAWIHPFGDGNGRTARLVEFAILIRAGVPLPAAHLLSNHYNQTRSEYYRQLSAASKSGGELIPFLAYAVQGLVDELREQIMHVRDEQMLLFWQNHVHHTLGEHETGRRRTHLVLDLTSRPGPVKRDAIAELSPRVARDYAKRDERTLNRDLAELVELGLIEMTAKGYRARIEQVLAYMPPSRQEGERK